MRRILSFLLSITVSVLVLPSCQKEKQTTDLSVQSNPSTEQSPSNQNGSKGYTPPFVYQVELSANISGVQGGGVWLWIGLNPNGTGDYSGSDCGHGGAGATSDKGDVTWQYSQDRQSLIISGVVLNGLDGFPTTITVPSTYGHYRGTAGSYLTLPGFIPPFVGTSQLQVAP